MYLVVLKTLSLSAAREAECGKAPSLDGSLSPRRENSKEVVVPSARVQQEYDEDFFYGRLFCNKNCVVKNKLTKGGFSTGKKIYSSCSERGYFIVVLICFCLFHMGISHFRIGTLLVLLSQILNSTTSDPRQDEQSSPFTTSLSQKVHGMRNCRACIVAETDNLSLMKHQRLCPLLFALLSRKITPSCFDCRPIRNRPLAETNSLCLAKFVYERTHRFAAVRTAVLLYAAHSHSSNTRRTGMPHAHYVACCWLCGWARL